MSNYRQSGTGSPYTGPGSSKTLTSERIAADIAAFNKAGGSIEVLGNTPFHRKSDEAKAPVPATHVSTSAAQASDEK